MIRVFWEKGRLALEVETIVTFLKQIGLIGLLVVMFLEGSSLPFPGVAVVLSYGYALRPSLSEVVIISIVMSIVYSIASFIPYALAYKSEETINKKFGKKLAKAQDWFRRYGLWSVCLTRPFSVGNYISYVAGMSKVPRVKYFFYTFIGILPWSIVMLFVGNEMRWVF